MNSVFEQYAVQFIQIILACLALIFFTLMISVIIRRIILHRREVKFEESEKKIKPFLHQYLDGDISRLEFSERLDNVFDIVAAFRDINLMIENLDGEEKIALRSLLEIPEFKGYYLKKLRSSNSVDIAQACMYFEQKNITDKTVIQRLQELQHHAYNVVAYASTMALLNVTNQKVRNDALQVFMHRKPNASMALNDIIFEYVTSHKNREDAVSKLMELISSSSVPSENSAAAVRVLTELDAYHTSEELIKIMSSTLDHDKKGDLTAALIHVLKQIADRDISEEIVAKRFWESPFQNVRLGMAEWLQENYTPVFESALLQLVHDRDLEVRIEAQKAMLHISNRNQLEKRLDEEQRLEWIEMKKSEDRYADHR